MWTLMNATGWTLVVAAVVIAAVALWATVSVRRLRRLERAAHQAEAALDLALAKRRTALAAAIGDDDSAAAALAASLPWRDGIPPLAAIADKIAFAAALDALDATQPAAGMTEAAARAAADTAVENARRMYNATAAAINQSLKVFPLQIVANALRIERKPFFDTATGCSDENV